MRRVALALVALTFGMLAAPVPGVSAQEVHGEWIVRLRDAVTPDQDGRRLARQYGGEVGHVYTHVLRGFTFRGSAQAAASLSRNLAVDAVDAVRPLHLLADGVPVGIMRIGGIATLTASPPRQGTTATGTRVRVGVLDSGVDTAHADLAPVLDPVLANRKSCVATSPSITDVIGHGTHVTGSVAAARNSAGIVGIAPDVEVVPVKVVDDSTGSGTDAEVICGIDHIAGLAAADGRPTVINMSLGDYGPVGSSCAGTPLRQAVCNAVSNNVTVVAAAGNNGKDINANPFVPAAYPEVIAVSAYTDGDGTAGGAAGCHFSFEVFANVCDDTLAPFTNRGASIAVTAPGVEVYSTVPGGGNASKTGTSMASPHVAGTAALALAANPGFTPAQVKALLRSTGECPGQAQATSTGTCTGSWANDTDGVAEPLVRADRASLPVGPPDTPPTVAVTSPASGAAVSGSVGLTASVGDDNGVSNVDFLVDGSVVAAGVDSGGTWMATWNSATAPNGAHTVTARATDTIGQATTSAGAGITVSNPVPVPGPVTLTAATAASKGVRLSWTAPATGGSPTSYKVYRATSATGTFSLLTTRPATPTNYTDTATRKNTTYWYRVGAVNAAGESAASNTASAKAR